MRESNLPPGVSNYDIEEAQGSFENEGKEFSEPAASPSQDSPEPHEVVEATKALAEGHRRLDAAEVPPAQYTVCDDPSCQSLIGHRIQTLIAERDCLQASVEALAKVIEGEAADKAMDAGLGVSEWEAFLSPEARVALAATGEK